MKPDINNKIVTAILENIPGNMKPVVYLMELLDISRESAYRRLRCEIPFTLEEMYKLSYSLDFSVDSIINGDNKGHVSFKFFSKEKENGSMSFYNTLKKCDDYLENLANAENAESIIALNCLPLTYYVFFDNLFKYAYYKWINQENGDEKKTFSEIEIPNEISVLQTKIHNNLKKINNSILILDRNIFLNLIRNIQYYYHRKLLNEAELNLLKRDVANLIDLFEKIARKGAFDPNATVFLYISSLFVRANFGYLKYYSTVESIYWIFPTMPVFIYNSDFCQLQKARLIDMKRQSTLISQSNEILQMEFFEKQRKYLDNLSAP